MGIAQLSFAELRGFMTADGTARTAAGPASLLSTQGLFTVPADWFALGKKMRVRAWGRCSWTVTAANAITLDVRFGAAVVFNGGAMLTNTAVGTTAAAQKSWKFEADLICRAVGGSANMIGSGRFESMCLLGSGAALASGNMSAALPWNSPPVVGANFNSAASQVVDLQVTWTGTLTADTTIQCHMFEVELQN